MKARSSNQDVTASANVETYETQPTSKVLAPLGSADNPFRPKIFPISALNFAAIVGPSTASITIGQVRLPRQADSSCRLCAGLTAPRLGCGHDEGCAAEYDCPEKPDENSADRISLRFPSPGKAGASVLAILKRQAGPRRGGRLPRLDPARSPPDGGDGYGSPRCCASRRRARAEPRLRHVQRRGWDLQSLQVRGGNERGQGKVGGSYKGACVLPRMSTAASRLTG